MAKVLWNSLFGWVGIGIIEFILIQPSVFERIVCGVGAEVEIVKSSAE